MKYNRMLYTGAERVCASLILTDERVETIKVK